MIKRTLLAAIVAATVATPALAVDFNGYFRAGTAISNNGTGDTSFEKQKVGRLGNENDNYSEIGLGKDLLNENGQKWRVETMIASGVSGSNGWEDGDFNIAQYNVQATGLLAFDKDATIWAGKRYYQRKDVHITDFYFLNTSGTGGGIENLSLGEQKLSVALMEDSASSQMTDGVSEPVKGYIADIRLADIDLWQGATLELAGAYNFATGTTNGNTDTKADDGFLGTAIVNQNLANGFNQTVLQYGTSSYGAQMSTMGSGAYFDRSGDQNDATGFRVINHGVVSTGNFEVGHQLMYA
ncbi:carbohydrate porin, partial [Vibrio barjaei]|uniref:carbohydrate porin n=1 Tax=Vibrio barjaei TaxID=1676683 RepID=UPI0022846E8A